MEKKTSRAVDKENLIQAVVIADNYNDNFAPASALSPVCLMPLVNRPMLDYTLECLSAAGVQEVILFCSSHADKIRDFVKQGNWGHMLVNIVVSEGCRSFGDAMRDLDAKAVIRTDFILLSGCVIGTLNLIPILDRHKKLQKMDKGAAMTVLFKESGNKVIHPNDEFYVGIDNKTDRILFHSKRPGSCRIEMALDSKIDLPLEVVLERNCLDLRCDLLDTGVSLCSVAVPPLFSDNFDFQTREDFIRGLLMNEEILASTLYAHILEPRQYAAEVTHWHNYHTISHDIMHRWTYPQVPGGFIDEMYSYRFGNIYLQSDISMELGSKLEEDVVIGKGTTVGAKSNISCTVIGKNCRVSSDCIIKNTHIFSNATIEAGCVIENSVIGNGCIIKASAKVSSCILGPDVVIPKGKSIQKLRLQSSPYDKDDDGIGDKAFEYKCEEDDAASQDSNSEVDDNDYKIDWISLDKVEHLDWLQYEDFQSDDGDDQSVRSSQPDDTNLFFSEVVDSLCRGLEDKLPCDNLVLEVNSSRYAYNVSLREVNYHVCRAVLSLHNEGSQIKWEKLKTTVDYFMPLLNNYIKNPEAMSDCLSAIEDVCESKNDLKLLSVKLLNYLYDKDVLAEESILEWHSTPRDNSAFSSQFRKQVMPFIKWLQEADEQSDSD